MVLLDKLLPKLKERDSRVLIFSQVIVFRFYWYCVLWVWQLYIMENQGPT